MPETKAASDIRIGAVLFWMTGALFAFSTFAVSIRALTQTLNVFELLSIRNGFGLFVLGLLALLRPRLRAQLRRGVLRLHLARNLVQFCAQIAWATSLTLLPLATVFAIEFTAPAWAIVFAAVFLRERLTVSRIGSVVLGIAGVMVIIRPGSDSYDPAMLLMLATAFGFAVIFILTKKLTATESTFAVLFWMNLVQLPLNLAGSDPLFFTRLGAPDLLPVSGVALAGLASHYCLTNAFRAGDAMLVVPLDFLRVPLIALVGFLAYDEALSPWVFAGSGLIAAGILWNLRAEAARPPGRRP